VRTGVEAKKEKERKLGCRVVVVLFQCCPPQLLGNQSRGLSGCRTVCYPKKNQPSL